MIDFNNPALKFEHELRAKLAQMRAHIEASTGATHITIRFEGSGSEVGKWSINSWGNGTADITTKGAQLDTVMAEHIRRVGVEKGLEVLPSMISYEPQLADTSEAGTTDEAT